MDVCCILRLEAFRLLQTETYVECILESDILSVLANFIINGFEKIKGKRLPNAKVPNDLEKVKDTLRAFINNPKMKVENVKEFQKTMPMHA